MAGEDGLRALNRIWFVAIIVTSPSLVGSRRCMKPLKRKRAPKVFRLTLLLVPLPPTWRFTLALDNGVQYHLRGT